MALAAVKDIAQEVRAQWSEMMTFDAVTKQDVALGWWMDEADMAEEDQPEDEAWWTSANLNQKPNKPWQWQSKTTYKGNFRDFKNDQSKGAIRCLRCNGNHNVADCPKPAPSQTAAVSSEEHAAPFMCFTDGQDLGGASMDDESGYVINRPPTTKEVVEQGKAVLGGGATRTLASVAALEKIMEINQSQKGHPGVCEVDLEDRPTFGFGNSSRNQCVSTAALKVSADGREGLRVHALDQGEGPLLFSIHTLRALGAVIGFSEDFVVFRTLSDRKGDPT